MDSRTIEEICGEQSAWLTKLEKRIERYKAQIHFCGSRVDHDYLRRCKIGGTLVICPNEELWNFLLLTSHQWEANLAADIPLKPSGARRSLSLLGRACVVWCETADVQAAKLVVRGSICERVAELKEAQSQKSELSRDRLREFLTEVILTPAGNVDEQSRLCQSYKVTSDVREIRMPDKLRAVEQLAKICGWNEPDKFEHGADDELTELLIKLRGGSP